MICKIDTSTEEGKKALKDLRVMVAGELNEMATQADKPKFVLEDYVKSIYDFVKENTEGDKATKHAMALSYAGLAVDAINKIQSIDETIGDYLFDQKVSLDKIRELSMLYKKATLESFADLASRLGIVETTAEDLEEESKASQTADRDTKSTTSLGTTKTDSKDLPDPDLKDINYKKPGVFTAAKPTANADQDQELLHWLYPNHPDHGKVDPTKVFAFKVKRFLLGKVFAPGMNMDSSNIFIPYSGKKGIYLTLRPIQSLPADQTTRDAAGPAMKDNDLVLVVTDADGVPVRFGEDGSFNKDGNISYHYYRKIYSDQVDSNGRVSLYKRKPTSAEGLIDDYDRAKALRRRNSALTEEQAQEAIRQELQMIYDINQAYKKNPTLKLRSVITGSSSFGLLQTDSKLYTPISEISFEAGEFAPKIATMDNALTGEKKGYAYFETTTTGSRKIEVVRFPVKKVQSLQDTLISLMIDELPFVSKFGTSRRITQSERERFVKNYLYLSSTGIQIFGNDTKDGVLKVKIRGKEIYRSLPTKQFNKETGLWEEADIEYTPEALAKNKEDIENARKALNEYFNTLGPQAKLDEKELSLEEKQKIIEGTDPLDPETIAKFKDFSIFRNTETGELWRITYPPVALNQEKLSSNTYSDVNLETVNDKLSFVEKEKSYVNFIKDNAYVHHPLNAENKLTAFNAYYAFDYLPEDLEKVFKKPEVDTKSALPQSTPTSKGPADNNNLKGIKSILDDPDFNKVMDQKNIDVKATEEQLKAVLPWWESSPLSKTGIKLEVLFDMVNTKNPKAIANMSLHALTLYKGADYSDLYHEAWHYFTQAFMTQEQRDALYAEAGKMKGSFTDYKGKTVLFKDANPKQIEEYLAEDFRAYMLSGGKKAITNAPVKKSLFQKILDFLQALFGDESFSVIDADNNSIRSIYEVYEKLRIGNLNEYNFSTKYYQWSSLDKGITALSEAESVYNLSYEDSKYVVDTIDSLLSKFVDDFSEVKRNQGLESYKWTKTLLQNAKGLKAGYQQVLIDLSYIRNGIQSKINNLDSQIANLSPEEATPYQLQKSKLVNKVNLLDWTIKNFGDTDNLMNNRPGKNEAPKGVIAYHQQKSKITTQEAKEAFFAEDVMKEEDMFLLGREGFDRKGNENSVKDMASEEILFILHGLHKTDRGGNLIYEENTEVEIEENGVKRTIGIPQLQDFDVTWNVLVKKLQNTLSAEVMVEKLVDLAEKRQDLPIGQLMKKMGPLNTKGKDEFNIWTNFFQTFNKTNIPLLQTTVELKTVDANGKSLAFENYEYNIRAVAATGDVNAIKAFWNSNFQTLSKPTKFIKKTPWGVNYLDTKAVMEAYPDGTSLKNKAIQFLNDIGIQLDDNEDINNPLVLEQLIKPINSLYLVIKELSENKHYKYTVTKPSILADQITKLDNKGEPIIEINPKTKKEKELKFAGENKNLNAIADIQAKYSEKWGNFQRTNAEGNTQFEHSLNNSLTVMINALNDAISYEELISAPWMKRLDVRKNPNAKASLWLRSMFDMDDFYKGGPGRKRLDPSTKSGLVELQIKNLSGVAYSENGNFDTDKGTASSSADSTTKFLMDFHMTLVNGATELMRHADKGTSYGVFLSTVLKPDLTDKKGYVNSVNFLKKEGEFTRAELEMYNLSVLPSLNAELTRIQDFRNKQEQIDKAKKEGKPSPVENFDFTYLKKGQGFVVFQGVLQASTKVRLIKEVKGDMLEYFNTPQGAELKELVLKDLSSYFKNETQKVADMFRKITKKSKRKSLISNNVIEEFRIKMSKDSDLRNVAFDPAYEGQIKLALIKTHVFSNWVHNIESINLIYGDLAQYNMAKEEFHKRNAGVTSTGDIYRTDQAAIDYVNNVLGRGYLKQEGIEDKYGPFTGRLNTAVVQDNEIRSSYFKEYAEAIIEDMVSRNVDRKEAERKVLGFDDKTGKTGTIENPIKGGKLWAYQNMNEGDAQGWITIDTYRILINLEGKWSDKQEALYQKIIKREPVGEKDIFETFPPQKLQYWGPLDTEGMPITAFHKFSLMPLVPSIIKNTNLKNLHDKMVREGIDYAVFNSGSKVGTITKDGKFDKLYADDNRTISNELFTKNVIFLNYLKNQLNIAPKYKNKVTFSTQLRKLIEGGLIENGVPTDYKGTKEQWDAIKSEDVRKRESKNYSLYKRYEDNLKELTELKKEELLEEMDWKMVDGQPQGNIENLVKFVRAELTRQDLAEHEIDFIDVVEGGKKLKHDLSMSSSASKIEKVLNSIVTNRLIKQKINGEGLIQVSGAAFESLESVLAPRKATKEEIKKWGTNDLPTYHQPEVDDAWVDFMKRSHPDWKAPKGYKRPTAAMKVKVAMQGKFKNLLKSKDVLDRAKEKSITPLQALNELVREDAWLNKGENRKMITMVGVRIPVQGINSAEFMEVYEFLPEEAGNIIIPPSEIVAKSGSDFDIDKLTVIMPNIAQYGENVKLVKFNKANVKIKKQLQEELQELYAMRTSTREMYDEWFTEDKEAGVFKTLTEEEKAIIEKLKEEFASKLKEINDKLNPLKDTWNKLSREQGRSFYTSNEFVETENQILNLTAEKEALYKDFDNNKDFYKSTFYNEKVRPLREKEQQDIDNINKQIAEVKEKIDSASTKGLENDLLNDIKEMLELPENYVTLITPNGTDVAEPLADELGPLVNDYNSKNIFTGKGTEKEDEFLREESPKSIQGTRVLEVGYNLSKHANNNVGKAVLGIGAVDNTMNSILNRVGAYLKPEATVWYSNNTKSVKVRQKILMDHNTMTLPDGSKAISLSHLYDFENKNSIGDLISQLMNGWVDVAKNAWVFNIQGNKEITPTLLFMIQAGVPFETAVYMVSQPIIREYVEEQRAGMSGFSSIMGIQSKSRNMIKFDAKKRILQKYYPEYFTLSDEAIQKAYEKGGQSQIDKEVNKLFSKKRLATFIENETTDNFSRNNGKIDLKTLRKNVEDFAIDPNKEINDYEKAVFLHFLELEDMAGAVKDIKMSMNFDTSRDGNIFEAQNRMALIERVRNNDRLPVEIVDKILTQSPISSFYISEFQSKIWEPLFKLRNKQSFNDFILEKMKDPTFYDDVENTFADKETFVNTFRNDLISKIFQDSLKSFNIDNIKSYKGYEVVQGEIPSSLLNKVEDVSSLRIGVFFKDGKVYLDKKTLAEQYINSAYARLDYDNLGLSKLDLDTFPTNGFKEYFHFVFEREYLRGLYGGTVELLDNPEFQAIRTEIQEKTPRGKGAQAEAAVSKGIEISSNAKGLAAALTNPTELAKSKDNIKQSYPIEFKGKTYKDVEEAYQILKDSSEAKTQPSIEKSFNYKLMVDLIKAKLEQHPKLISEIAKQGGSAWILSSTHQPTKKNTVWETGGKNWFIKALNDAYSSFAQPQAETKPQAVANIPQNKVSGVESYGSLVAANDAVTKVLGPNPHSIDMIEAGFRTRTTRSEKEMDTYSVKVGDIIKHFGKSADGTTKNIYARVTAIHPKGSPGWKGTWEKEGWRAQDVDVINRFKDGAAAIEFEVIKPTQAPVVEESLDSYYNRINALAFEEFIKEKALTNTYNTKTLFKGNRTYADKLNMIKTKFADENLIERYPVLRVLGVDATVIDKVNRYANIKLVANLNDTEELNSFYEQMLDLQNPTVKKVENPEANKFISEYFANLTMVSMLQSGLNTSSRFSITRLMPQDSYIRLMEKPIKDRIDNLSDLYLEEYYKMFVEQNNISRYKLRDRFKDYTSRYGSAENFRNNIRREQKDLAELGEPRTFRINTQTSGAKVIDSSVLKKGEDAEKIMLENPDLIFMYRDVVQGKSPVIMGPGDLFFRNQPLSNKLGIPDRNSSSLTVKDLVKDVDGKPNPDIVKLIDEMVDIIEKSGKTPVFTEQGYGQEWIGFVPEDAKSEAVKNAILPKTAPQTFLYLSKVLFEKFGYVNKNYDKTTTGRSVIQSKQPITDEMVLEFMRKCYT